MLARGMVPGAERRQEYLETLRKESERLSHLVENVLSYARLERGCGPTRCEQLSVDELIKRLEPRLTERTAQADLVLLIELPAAAGGRQMETDVGVVEQIVFNLVDNAAKYAVQADDRRIHCQVRAHTKRVALTIRGHGPGFDQTRRSTKPRPFSKTSEQAAVTAPDVGLGLALCSRLANQLGGKLEIASRAGGAAVTLQLPLGS